MHNNLTHREGFTLVELLLFAAIFTVAAMILISVLVSVTQVQVRQAAVAEVNQQSQFLLQTIQRYVQESSLVEMNEDAPTSTLKLRMSSSSLDPTFIYLDPVERIVFLKQTATGTPQALTNSKVRVAELTFVKRANPPAHDSVNTLFTVVYNSDRPGQRFGQRLQTGVARVGAATFDSSIFPSSTVPIYDLGTDTRRWKSVNNVIHFSGNNVGIGVVSPLRALEVSGDVSLTGLLLTSGGIHLNTPGSLPGCVGVSDVGKLWFLQQLSPATDTLKVCVKKGGAAATYGWADAFLR